MICFFFQVSSNIVRKYSGPIDIWLSFWTLKGEMHCLVNEHPLRSYAAMSQHLSQWVWYVSSSSSSSSPTLMSYLSEQKKTDCTVFDRYWTGTDVDGTNIKVFCPAQKSGTSRSRTHTWSLVCIKDENALLILFIENRLKSSSSPIHPYPYCL